MDKRKLIVALVLVAFGIGAIAAAKMARMQGIGPGPSAEKREKGNPSAPVKIIEHIDYQCGACGYGSALLKQYMNAYPDKIHLTVHFFPLKSHSHGEMSARFAYCAQQEGRFWAYHDKLFETAPQWSAVGDPVPFFTRLAEEVGIDSSRVAACAADPASLDEVLRIQRSAEAKGVNSTPTFYVNGKMIVGTAALLREMKELFPDEKTQAAQQPR